MIEVDYRHFGLLKAKQVYFGDSLPSCEGYDFIDCKNYYIDLPYQQPFTRIKCQATIIDLTQDSDTLFGKIHKSRRNKIRKGLKQGFIIKIQKPDLEIINELDRLYRKFSLQRGAPKKRSNSLISLMPYATFIVGEFENIIYEIKMVIDDGQTVRGHVMARNEHHPRYQDCANLGCVSLWESVLHFQRLGYQTFDLGPVELSPEDPNSLAGISEYKLSFGGAIVPTYWYQAKISSLARALDSGRKIYRGLKKNL
jgi:hypothetical protein